MTAKVRARAAVAGATRRHPQLATEPGAARKNADAQADRFVSARLRFAIVSALAVREQLTFNELKELFGVSDGNLSAHARKLEEAKYLTCTKSFEDRRPKSVYRLTPLGKTALHRYLDHVEAVIKATRGQ